MFWSEIRVETPADSAEAVVAALLEMGCQGVAETGHDPRALTGFLPASDDSPATLQALRDRLSRLPEFGLPAPSSIEMDRIDDKDWANEWKKHYHPLEIGNKLVIKPSWELYDSDPHRAVVELDPGMAFGTGGHPTTRLCLELLERYVQPGWIVADIGTGSGILSLAAARVGAARVHATDIDSLPRKIARENVARNGLEEQISIHEMVEFDAAAMGCDLVVANIIADTIIELLPSIAARLKPGGIFIGSGIVEERLQDVLDALSGAGLQHQETRSEEIWRAVVATR